MNTQYNQGCLRVNIRRCFTTHKHGCTLQGMTTLALRIKKARNHAGLTQNELHEKSGVAQQMISKLELGKSSETSKLVQLAVACGVRPEWLATGQGPMEQAETIPGARPVMAWDKREDLPGTHLFVRHVRVRFSAGSGQIEFEEEDDGHLAFTRRWMKKRGLNQDQLLVVSAIGDSMVPTITDGSSIVLDRSQFVPQDGHIYAIRYGEELRVKRIYKRYDGGLVLRSDNGEKYPDEAIPPDDLQHITIIGRVVHISNDV